MNNLPFVIWMVGFPISRAIEQGVDRYIGNTYSHDVQFLVAFASFCVWVFVGMILYRRDQ